MYRLSHYLFESDMQYLGEVERALATPPEGILQLSNMEGTYRFPDNTIWQFEKTEVTDRYGETYIQLTAADVTELCHVLGLLFVENKKAREIFIPVPSLIILYLYGILMRSMPVQYPR